MFCYNELPSISTNNPFPAGRLRHLAARIHGLGPRPLSELLVELTQGAEVVPALERHAQLLPLARIIAEMGCDRFVGRS